MTVATKRGRITYIRKRRFPDGVEDRDEKRLTTLMGLRPDDTNADSATIVIASLDDFMAEAPKHAYWGSPYADFAESFKMPRDFHRVTTMGISSLFNSYEQFENEDDPNDKSISFMLRFKIKLFAQDPKEEMLPDGSKPIAKVGYTWGTSTVFIKIEGGKGEPLRTLIFMVDAPDHLNDLVRKASIKRLLNPFYIYATMVSDATQRFEKSIWALRDVIRDQEKNRPGAEVNKPDKALYPHLHDLQRHVIHSTEACDSAIVVLDELLYVMNQFIEDYKRDHVNTSMIPSEVISRKAYNVVRNERVYLQSLRNRSQTLYERLKNEINLTFNMVTQADSAVSRAIGVATREDSKTMTFIGLLTTFFLPATAVATIYGANFLPLNEETNRISPSKDNAIFWLISAILTLAIFFSWFTYKHFTKGQNLEFDVASTMETTKRPNKTSADSDDEGNNRERGLRPTGKRIGTFWNTTRKRGARDGVTTTETVADIESGPRT